MGHHQFSCNKKKLEKKKKKEAITYGEEDFVKGEGVFFFIGKTCTKFHSDIWKPCSTIISCLLSKRVILNCNFFLPKHVGYLFCPSNRFFRSLVGSSVLGAGSSISAHLDPQRIKKISASSLHAGVIPSDKGVTKFEAGPSLW
jgi:hypothetical protein